MNDKVVMLPMSSKKCNMQNKKCDYKTLAIMNTPCYQRLLMIDDSGDVECIYDIKLD